MVGVELVYTVMLYTIFLQDEEYISFAHEVLLYELEKLQEVEGMFLLKVKDERLMPYFSVGSAGLVIPLLLMKDFSMKKK